MSTVRAVQAEYVDLISDLVPDLNADRVSLNKAWVFDDLPRADLSIANYPRVSVVPVSTSVSPHQIGSSQERVAPKIAIQVRVPKTSKYTIGGSLRDSNYVVDYLAGQIGEVMRSGTARSQLLTNVSVYHTFLESENVVQGDAILIKELIYKNEMVR
jgi:hypothetical protein